MLVLFPVVRVIFFVSRLFHEHSQDEILNSTREAMRSRLHVWAREIPIVSHESLQAFFFFSFS